MKNNLNLNKKFYVVLSVTLICYNFDDVHRVVSCTPISADQDVAINSECRVDSWKQGHHGNNCNHRNKDEQPHLLEPVIINGGNHLGMQTNALINLLKTDDWNGQMKAKSRGSSPGLGTTMANGSPHIKYAKSANFFLCEVSIINLEDPSTFCLKKKTKCMKTPPSKDASTRANKTFSLCPKWDWGEWKCHPYFYI